jgi:hypothetical protein
MPQLVHFAVAWDWEFDREFISLLEGFAASRRLQFYSVSHQNLEETVERINTGDLHFLAFMDRASDTDERFLPLSRLLREKDILHINPVEMMKRASDKATMHLEFLTHGIDVPFTIIISPYSKKQEVELSLTDLAQLGRPFIIKPANTTGGGVGVIMGAETLKDVLDSRQHHKNDKYLLQQEIRPAAMDGHKAWFRVFSVSDRIFPCWWDPQTHCHYPIHGREMRAFRLEGLITATRRIRDVCKLDFFSTEIATTPEMKFVAVDYVNEICDMRLQSQHIDGVPDIVVQAICRTIIERVRQHHVSAGFLDIADKV